MTMFEIEPDNLGPETMFHPDDMPIETLVLEATLEELRERSGIVDTYKRSSDVTIELNNLQAIELFERAGHGSQVFI